MNSGSTLIVASADTPAAITVTGTIIGASTGSGTLQITNTGGTTFANIIGGTRLAQLTINGATTFQDAVQTTLLTTTAAISSGTSLNVSGASSIGGNITTTGAQTYTGATTLTASPTLTSNTGLIAFGSTVDGAYTLTVTNNSSTGDLTFSGAVGATTPLTGLTITTDVLTAAAIKSTGTLSVTNTGASSITGIISEYTSALAVTKAGTGTLTLSGANTYTGDTTISSGTLRLGTSGVISDSSNLIVNGTFDMNGFSEAVASLSGSGIVTSSRVASVNGTDSGLVVYLDAGSYSGSGNWIDLTNGSPNATPVNNPTFNSSTNAFTLNGSNQYFTLGSSSSEINFYGTDSYTINVWFKLNATGAIQELFSRHNGAVAGNYHVYVSASNTLVAQRTFSTTVKMWGQGRSTNTGGYSSGTVSFTNGTTYTVNMNAGGGSPGTSYGWVGGESGGGYAGLF
ncbi:MAG: hypothetical protein EBU08_19895, partial [Micrococcales bacterium]|nr:hypothetical protein [Micrococcales bacterium]